MVSMELFNIVEDIKNVSKAFVVHPRNVNAENATSKTKPFSTLAICIKIFNFLWQGFKIEKLVFYKQYSV